MDIEFCEVGPDPEDVVVLVDGSIVSGLADGRIVRVAPDFATVETVTTTKGRPLGLDLMADGRVVYCDTELGLWACDPDTGATEPLASHFEGEALNFCNNPCVAADGSIWFSTSSRRYTMDTYLVDIVENRPSGRLFRLAPDGELTCHLDELAFANGVAVAPDQSAVLVAETGHATIRRVWLTGDRAGQSDVFARDLPGFPDNMAVTPDGQLLVSLVAPYTDDLKRILTVPFPLRWVIARLPAALQPKPERHVMLGLYDFDGSEVAQLDVQDVGFHTVTGSRMVDDWILLGTIEHTKVARIPRSALTG